MKIPLKRRSRSLSRSDIKGTRNDRGSRSGDDFRGETVKGEGYVSADRVLQESRGVKLGIKWGVNEPVNIGTGGRFRIWKEEQQIASHLPSFLCEKGGESNFVWKVAHLSSLDYGRRDKREDNFSALPASLSLSVMFAGEATCRPPKEGREGRGKDEPFLGKSERATQFVKQM